MTADDRDQLAEVLHKLRCGLQDAHMGDAPSAVYDFLAGHVEALVRDARRDALLEAADEIVERSALGPPAWDRGVEFAVELLRARAGGGTDA